MDKQAKSCSSVFFTFKNIFLRLSLQRFNWKLICTFFSIVEAMFRHFVKTKQSCVIWVANYILKLIGHAKNNAKVNFFFWLINSIAHIWYNTTIKLGYNNHRYKDHSYNEFTFITKKCSSFRSLMFIVLHLYSKL